MTITHDHAAWHTEGDMTVQPVVTGMDLQFAMLVISHILARVRSSGSAPSGEAARGGLAPYQLRRVLEHMEKNLSDDVSLTELTALAGLSPSHFCHAFKRSTGVTPRGWLRECRIARARQILCTTDLPLSEVALACGFADQAHFSRTFRELEGHPPGAWRRARRA